MKVVSDLAFGVLGGAMIGGATALFMWLNGRILGISGIAAGLLHAQPTERRWREVFVAGLLSGGALLAWLHPQALAPLPGGAPWVAALGGLLVGFGSRLGSGCTSGHGVCGLSRLSPRSFIAVATFMATGMLTVYIVRVLAGG